MSVWSATNTAESSWRRKAERTLFFTAEFTFKAMYAKLIEWGAKTSYETPVTEIYLVASTTDSLNVPGVTIVREEGDKKLISITRWGVFTTTITALADHELDIQEIGGNDEIVVSVLAGRNRC